MGGRLVVGDVNLKSVYRIPSPRASVEGYTVRSPKEIDSFVEKMHGIIDVVDSKDVSIDYIVGEGNFGKVYRGTYFSRPVAVKVLKIEDEFSTGERSRIFDEFTSEAMAMAKLKMVERIARVVCVTLNPMQLVMEYYQKGSVSDLLRRESDLHFITRMSIVKDIAEGVMNMHTARHIHRDIAARNILVDEDYRAYISDFGKARFSELGYAHTHDRVVAVKWASPESFDNPGEVKYSTQTDVWAFGVTVYEVLTNTEPYMGVSHQTMMDILRKREGKFLELPEEFDVELRDVVNRCLMWNPEDRSDMEEHFVAIESYLDMLIENRWWLGRRN